MTAPPPETTEPGAAPPAAPPLVVSRRWDQLGGRLTALVNARSVAEALGLDVRFVWPRGADSSVHAPEELFSRAFLDACEVPAGELRGRPAITVAAFAELEDPPPHALVEVDEVFAVEVLPGETAATAAARFRRCFAELGWSAEASRLVDACARAMAGRDMSAVHVRAGDIVTGGWRHLVAHEKYTPTPFVDHAVEVLADEGRRDVLVMSDNAPYLAWLRERFPTVVTPAGLVDGYAELTDAQRALADILLLSHCRRIAGPPRSAFSRLAANAGGGEVLRADRLVPEGREVDVLRAGIALHETDAATAPFWRGLVARDICWTLDVFAGVLPPAEERSLAERAVALDPGFGGALARLARIAALGGDGRAARRAAALALRIAEPLERHADPLVEALATDIAVRCFAIAGGRLGTAADARGLRWSWRLEPVARRRRERIRRAVAELKETYLRCVALHPYQMDPEAIAASLRLMLATVEWLPAGGGAGLQHAARGLDPPGARPPAEEAAGLELHRASATFDPVARDLERMVTVLQRAVSGSG